MPQARRIFLRQPAGLRAIDYRQNNPSPITLLSSYNLPVMIPQDLLEILVCPACKKPLVLKTNPEALKCNACNRVYPVRDNIPVLLIDQASTDPS